MVLYSLDLKVVVLLSVVTGRERKMRAVPLHVQCLVFVFCNVTNKIRKRTDTTVAFTQEYSRVSY